MAAQTLTGRFTAKIELSEVLASALTNSQSLPGSLQVSLDYSNGNTATAGAINQEFCKGATTVTLNSNTNATYTLTSLTDDAGRSKSFANGVRGLLIYVTSRSTGGYLEVGAAASNAWTGLVNSNTAVVRVYDFFAVAVGNSTDKYTVTANSSEQIKISNPTNSAITFKLATWGNT